MSIIQHLSLDEIKAVLQAIRYAKPLPSSQLYDDLKRKQIITEEAPKLLQDYLVTEWISNIITTQYNHQRSLYGLTSVSPDMPKHKLMSYLKADYNPSDVTLEAWSVMLVYYGGLHACISTDEYMAIVPITGRTLRRRQTHGIELLYLQILLR